MANEDTLGATPTLTEILDYLFPTTKATPTDITSSNNKIFLNSIFSNMKISSDQTNALVKNFYDNFLSKTGTFTNLGSAITTGTSNTI